MLLLEEEISPTIKQKMSLEKLPHYLILDLKRYQFDLATYSIKKITKAMQFEEYLTLHLADESSSGLANDDGF